MNEWTDWLAAIGYGINFSTDVPPPCSRRDPFRRSAAPQDQRRSHGEVVRQDRASGCVQPAASTSKRCRVKAFTTANIGRRNARIGSKKDGPESASTDRGLPITQVKDVTG